MSREILHHRPAVECFFLADVSSWQPAPSWISRPSIVPLPLGPRGEPPPSLWECGNRALFGFGRDFQARFYERGCQEKYFTTDRPLNVSSWQMFLLGSQPHPGSRDRVSFLCLWGRGENRRRRCGNVEIARFSVLGAISKRGSMKGDVKRNTSPPTGR